MSALALGLSVATNATTNTTTSTTTRAQAQAAAFASILACSTAEFTEELQRRAQENPALLVRVRPRCPVCASLRRPGGCACRLSTPARADFEPLGVESVRQSLLRQTMTPDQRAVLEALTRSGLLDDDAEDLLAQVGVAGQRLEEAIIGLRTIGDSALGTRTPAELLLAQLRDLDVDDRTYAQAAALFGELSEAFIGGQDELLCAQLPCTPVELDALRRLFRTRLRPSLDLDATTSSDFLGEPVVKRNAADAAASDRRHTTSSPDAGGPVDVTFQIHGDRIEVVVSELDDLDVRIDPAWTHAMAKLSFRRSDRPTTRSLPALPSRTSSFADNERMLIIEQYDAANRLVRAVRSREQMLSLVANALAQHHGNRWMRSGAAPMTITRRAVAQTIGVHESTVSRVVQRRVAALPDGSITTLAALFDLPRSAQLTTWALLTEQPTLSDRAIAGELARQGIAVARRTVTKYRHQLRAS